MVKGMEVGANASLVSVSVSKNVLTSDVTGNFNLLYQRHFLFTG